MRVPCIKCKGRDPSNCGRTFCPIVAKSDALFKVKDKINKEDFFGSSPAPFVGRFGYPHINVGILSPPEQKDDAWLYDAPNHWSKEEFKIPQIVDLRSSLINSRFKAYVKERSDRLLGITQEVGMASKPVDIEVNLKKKPVFRLNTDAYMAPTGPNADLKKIEITSNPKIHTKVDKVVSDTGLKSADGLVYLYNKGFDENFLSKLLSVGTLGFKDRRKLVPTRWSITATDDTLCKNMLPEIRQYPESDYLAYFGSYLGNYYLILFFSEFWSYELFESYLPMAGWNPTNKLEYSTDSEGFYGRKDYAENCVGGYYTVRLALAEKMKKMKRQASVLVLRFITGEYAIPLGVWVTREAARKTLSNKPIKFSDKKLMLTYARNLIKKKFGVDIDFILKESVLLKDLGKQKRLSAFI
ncbi:hypothetical protein KY310_04535 [Candidatus Woesearchaeota archaeon]|nr:hypothetical protein [Candidatus Woesearchaeota archaeon]